MISKNILKTLSFALLLILLFIFLRIGFILYIGIYYQELGTTNLSDLLRYFYNAAIYDNRNVAIFSILYFLCSFLLKNKILIFLSGMIFALCIFLSIGNMLFYTIYQDIYNLNLLGIIFDNRLAILKTGLSGEYFISIKGIIWIFLTYCITWLHAKITYSITTIKLKITPIITILMLLFLLLSLTFMINGSFSIRGKSLDQQIIPSHNTFLKRTTTDIFRSLFIVYKGYKIIKNSKMQDFYNGNIKEILIEYFHLHNPPKELDIYKLLEQSSHNSSTKKIQHIFYIISESMSQWFYHPLYDQINLVSATKNLLNTPHALYFEPFLENAPTTAKSLETQICGILQLDIPLQNLLGKLPTLKTSIGYHLQKLGYENKFYFGGSGNWQKIEKLSYTQGFTHFFDDNDLENFSLNKNYPEPYKNIWGFSDAVLFDFILQNTQDTPSFNMIMTTSNHSPYNLPLDAYHVPMDKIKQFIQKNSFSIDPKILGHAYWYDKILANFIQKMSIKYPNSLFVITGDHFGRAYVKNVNLSITKQIPLIIYAPTLTLHKTTSIGSHIDIPATILELISPNGFKFISFGKPLASNNPFFKISDHTALGYFAIATPFIIYNEDEHYYYDPLIQHKNSILSIAKQQYKKLNQARAISWHLIFKGNKIK